MSRKPKKLIPKLKLVKVLKPVPDVIQMQEPEVVNDNNNSSREEESTTISKTGILDNYRDDFDLNFKDCVRGYHRINNDPIKEAPWEAINAEIFNESGCVIESQSNGSHKSGGDLYCCLGGFSNKSTQYNKTRHNSFNISSYRLTKVCSDKKPGNIENIITEIDNRKDFKYYSIIVRECTEKEILYDWYVIPSNFPVLNPASYNWHPKVGKMGDKKGSIIGWETDMLNGSSMSITFSMSSQLWINVKITEEIKNFIVSSCRVDRGGRKYTYKQLGQSINNDCPSI